MSMENMLGWFQGFSISREDEVLWIDDEWVDEGKSDVRFGLLVKAALKETN